MKDFTHNIYKELLTTFLDKDYQFIRVADYFSIITTPQSQLS